MGQLFVMSLARVRRVILGVLMYVEWYGVCNCVVYLVLVFHRCFGLCVVFGIGICVDVCG